MEEQGGYVINSDVLFFFNEKPAAILLYEAFAKRILAEIDSLIPILTCSDLEKVRRELKARLYASEATTEI